MGSSHQTAELRWVFRPAGTRPAHLRALAGAVVHGIGPAGPDGEAQVTLADGTQLRARSTEIVAE